jgi:hypothetical protein
LGLNPIAPAKKKASTGDDARDGGVSSAGPHAPNLISSVAARVPIIVRPTGEHGRKHPTHGTRWKKLVRQVDQVMI